MAVIKCIECGGNVSDKAEICPHCGAPVKEMIEQIEKEKQEAVIQRATEAEGKIEGKRTTQSKKIWISISIIIALAAVGFGYYQVTKDREAPVISGMEEGQIVEIVCGTDFNLNDYVSKSLKIKDNKDGDINNYTVLADKKIYDSKTGKIDSREKGEYDIKVATQDKAENKASFEFKIKLEPVHLSKNNPTPVVYDGELGKIKVTSFKHGYFWGENQYQLNIEYTNKTEKGMSVWLISKMTYVNDEQMNVYHTVGSGLMPGKKGTAELSIYDTDLKKHKNAKTIETAMGIMEMDEDSPYFWIPMTIDLDAAEQ